MLGNLLSFDHMRPLTWICNIYNVNTRPSAPTHSYHLCFLCQSACPQLAESCPVRTLSETYTLAIRAHVSSAVYLKEDRKETFQERPGGFRQQSCRNGLHRTCQLSVSHFTVAHSKAHVRWPELTKPFPLFHSKYRICIFKPLSREGWKTCMLFFSSHYSLIHRTFGLIDCAFALEK